MVILTRSRCPLHTSSGASLCGNFEGNATLDIVCQEIEHSLTCSFGDNEKFTEL
jgi:hypothetical protein